VSLTEGELMEALLGMNGHAGDHATLTYPPARTFSNPLSEAIAKSRLYHLPGTDFDWVMYDQCLPTVVFSFKNEGEGDTHRYSKRVAEESAQKMGARVATVVCNTDGTWELIMDEYA
jgi:hypothetical protein